MLVILREYLIPMLLQDFLFFEKLDVKSYHFCNHLSDTVFTFPSELCLCLGCISEKEVNFCGTEVDRIHFD
jgi:hypothetical protein